MILTRIDSSFQRTAPKNLWCASSFF